MECVGCRREGYENPWSSSGSAWCDHCGGIMLLGPNGPRLFFRHVCTADGDGGRYPIVYDISTSNYAVIVPGVNPRAGMRDEEGFRTSHLITHHGSLDAVIALIQPYARGLKDAPLPKLSVSPHATEFEKSIVLMRSPAL